MKSTIEGIRRESSYYVSPDSRIPDERKQSSLTVSRDEKRKSTVIQQTSHPDDIRKIASTELTSQDLYLTSKVLH